MRTIDPLVTMSIVVLGKGEEKWYRWGLNKTRPIGYRRLNKEYRSGSMPSANVDALLPCSSLASVAPRHLPARCAPIPINFRVNGCTPIAPDTSNGIKYGKRRFERWLSKLESPISVLNIKEALLWSRLKAEKTDLTPLSTSRNEQTFSLLQSFTNYLIEILDSLKTIFPFETNYRDFHT